MSADLLRRAAALMRERAEAVDDWYSPEAWATTAPFNLPIEKADAAHIASWHPVVALAVAKAMDDVADAWEIADESNDGLVRDLDDDLIPFEDTIDSGWVAAARAYLGEAS